MLSPIESLTLGSSLSTSLCWGFEVGSSLPQEEIEVSKKDKAKIFYSYVSPKIIITF